MTTAVTQAGARTRPPGPSTRCCRRRRKAGGGSERMLSSSVIAANYGTGTLITYQVIGAPPLLDGACH
jgi:hypothetical protein